MRATIKTFKSKAGDCIFFLLEEDEKRFVIMIDCGKYTSSIKDYVEHELDRHINLLVATHIDNDHIDGLVEMLEQTPDLKVDKILYNCNQLWDGRPKRQPSEDMQHDLQVLRTNLPPKMNSSNGKIKAGKAVTLAEKLSEKAEWWEAWKKNEYVSNEIGPIPLDEENNKFGQLIVLSPKSEDIEKLNDLFKVEQGKLTKHIIDEGGYVEGQETLFELVARLAALKRKNYEVKVPVKVGAALKAFNESRLKKAYEFEPIGVSDENVASIALMWEYGVKKVLFMGDAEPDDIANKIKDIKGEGKQEIEAIKVSHHGSKHSTSLALMECVDSDHYFFTGGNLKDKPSLEAIIKIVNRKDTRARTLHFNNVENAIVKALRSEQESAIREKYNFEITDENEYQFEY